MSRRVVLFVVSLFILFGSLTATFATLVERDFQLRGYADATQEAHLPFRVSRLGVNADLTQYDDEELAHQLDLMQQAQVTWVRQFAYWDEIEAERGQYNWEQWDQIVAAVDTYPDIRLVAVLMNAPDWARSGGTITGSPEQPGDFATFATGFAQRYGPSIDHYQIWDEPNLNEAWGGLNPRPAQYAALLQAAYEAIHGADPDSMVIAAALAPTVEGGPQNISDLAYLDDLFALGAADFMDAAAAKPYGFSLSALDRTIASDTLNFSRIIALREIMLRHGDGESALWASNWGWNALPGTWAGYSSIWGSVEPDAQVAYSLQALDRADREWPWLGGMILQHWQPDAAPDVPVWGFALIDQEGNPTALWQALADQEPTVLAANGLYSAANPYATYNGVWTFGNLGADIGWINDSSLTFNFAGRDIALLLRQDNYVAYLYPTVDGEQANALPRDVAGNAYIVLTSDTREPNVELVPVSRNLDAGDHELRVVADNLVPDEAEDRWALVGYTVSSGDLRVPYDRQILIAAITGLVAGIAVITTGRNMPWGQIFQPVTTFWHSIGDLGQLLISGITSVALMFGMLLTWGDSVPALFRREPVQLGIALLTAGLVYIQPGLILMLVALAATFVIVYHRPDIGLALTVFWAPFFLFPVALFQFFFPMAEILILVTAAGWLLRTLGVWGRLRQLASSDYPVMPIWSHFNTLDWAVIAWVGLGILSLAWTELRGPALTELRTIIIEPAVIYLIIRSALRSKKQHLLLVDALLMAGVAVALIGLVLFLRGDAIITAEAGSRRLASVYGSPNNLGLFLGKCIPFALAYAISPVDRSRRIAAVFALIVMVVAVVLSQSAGALLIGVPLSVAAVLLLTWGRRVILLLAGFAVLGLAGLAFLLRSARFARLLDFDGGTNFTRLRVWHSALNVIRDRPVRGLGLDQFLYAFRGAYISPDAWQEPDLSHPHNILLDFWIRLGLAGLVVLFWIQAAFWIQARQVYRRFKDSDPLFFALSIGLMGSMVNLLAHGLVDNSVFVNDLAVVFMCLMAMMNNLANGRAIDGENKKMV